jgi:hypothetical protein
MGFFKAPELTPAQKVRRSLVMTILRVTERREGNVYRAVGPLGEKLYVADKTKLASRVLGMNFFEVSISYGLRRHGNNETFDEYQFIILRGEEARKYSGVGRISSKREFEQATVAELAELDRFILTWNEI